MRFDEIENLAKQIRDLERVNIRFFESITKASQLNLAPLLRQMDSMVRAVDVTRRIPMELEAITAQGIAFRREIERLTSAFRLDIILDPALQSFAEITHLQHAALKSLDPTAVTSQISEQSFIGTLLDELPDVIGDEKTLQETSRTVTEAFKKKADELPPSGVNLIGLLGILLTLLLFLVNQQQDLARDERLARQIDEVREKIITKFEDRIDEDNEAQKVFYFVKTAYKVRRDRSHRSPIVGIVYRNQLVEVVEHRKKWIYVHYFDYMTGTNKEGWIYKKYTKRVSGPYSL